MYTVDFRHALITTILEHYWQPNMILSSTLVVWSAILGATKILADVPQPPEPESFNVIELPLPPVAPSSGQGACTADVNPKGTGCIAREVGEFQAGGFTRDGNHIVVNVVMVGAPAAPDAASIYTGEQLILVKTDGSAFSNGDPWKCVSCAVPPENAVSLDPQRDYPQGFRGDNKILWGHNIVDCEGEELHSDSCTPEKTHIYPIHWNTKADGSGSGPRELRIHPDGEHLGWSAFTGLGGQFGYFGKLEFVPATAEGVARYELVNVYVLTNPNGKPPIEVDGTELHLHDDAITVGELRGFSGTGDEITYIGSPVESNNIDVFAVHLVTGNVRRLTSHPEYTDPMAYSSDNEWFVVMDTRGTDRQMFMSGMRQIPPLIDLVAVTVASSTRNNGPRRFFQPILIDRYGDRGDYFGQRINAAGDGSNGSINDPNWNGRADPGFSPDGTKIAFWQALVVSPSCGGVNPLPCPVSTADGGREYRLMLATRLDKAPVEVPPAFQVPDVIPWAILYTSEEDIPLQYAVEPGNYTLQGRESGIAHVTIIGGENSINGLERVAVNYSSYSDDGEHFLDGTEDVTVTVTPPNYWTNHVEWYSDLVQTGVVNATKKTSPGGFFLEIDAEINIFNATGSLTTTIDGVVYEQPLNGT
ncbi:unnamed protein product [Clonostachys rhizophaga]|uniref:Saponin hydrolase n=1 Tax=Clonostachys rhizophaga TaxID=160324 RepID=A0A9N9W0N5_9HYPO|nr:unnamed protein product [Clonostachys rhizophaga]